MTVKLCGYPGCAGITRSRKTTRCVTHQGMRVAPTRLSRKAKYPRLERWWCTPCHSFVYSLIHVPRGQQ